MYCKLSNNNNKKDHFYLQFSFKLRNFVMKNLFHSRNQWKLKRKFFFVLTTIPVNDVMKVIDCFCKENDLLSLHSVMISWPVIKSKCHCRYSWICKLPQKFEIGRLKFPLCTSQCDIIAG